MSCGSHEAHVAHVYTTWRGEYRECDGLTAYEAAFVDDDDGTQRVAFDRGMYSDDAIHQSASWHEREMTGEPW